MVQFLGPSSGIALDYDAAHRFAGIEILDGMHRLGNPETLKQVVFETSTPSETDN